LNNYRHRLAEAERRLASYTLRLDEPFEFAAELRRKCEELADIEVMLEADVSPPIEANDHVEEEKIAA
uniref:hypothetical protein n=1 Tax=Streptococcus pneumoniae TaxID=1313 RepID=UPI001954C43E